jgi:hypothetical protein
VPEVQEEMVEMLQPVEREQAVRAARSPVRRCKMGAEKTNVAGGNPATFSNGPID